MTEARTRAGAASRREVLRGGACVAAGLVIGVVLPGRARAQSGAAAILKGPQGEPLFAPNAFIRIAPDDTVTVIVKHLEFGQGPMTGLATLVAEELDAEWAQMHAELAPANTELYKNLAFGIQGTGGSTAIANSYEQMRKAGAAARAMLVSAAAEAWGVNPQEIDVKKGIISHAASGKAGRFGFFAERAARLTPPQDVALKDAKDFTLIGTDLPKLDSRAKSTGEAVFTIDLTLPDMLTVLMAHPPRFGGKAKAVDAAAALRIEGVVDVKIVPAGVAVYARNFWAAKKGRDALRIEWDDSDAETRSSAEIVEEYRETAKAAGAVALENGDVGASLKTAAKTLEAEYIFPYLAHAPMETLDCVIYARDGAAEAWCGSQLQSVDHGAIAKILELPPEKVVLNTMFAGGSFGRRATAAADMASEAAMAAKAFAKPQPLKLVWTREDDIKGGFYRPLTVHRLRGGLDAAGKIVGWDEVIVSQSILAGTPFATQIKDGIDSSMVEGARDLPYAIPSLRVTAHMAEGGVPVLWWRSVGHTHTGFATETFLDELLALGGQDPVAGRLALLKDHARHAGALEAAAELAGWGGAVPQGRARGVAVHKSFESYVAQIAEVSESEEGLPRVHKVWCAIDCGVAVNPNVVRAQMEGGIGFGLGAVLFDEITLKDGRVVQSNFDDYRALRINEMPEVEVTVVKSAEAPTGVGEPGVPPIGPAVANAWAKLTGMRVRRLPFLQAES